MLLRSDVSVMRIHWSIGLHHSCSKTEPVSPYCSAPPKHTLSEDSGTIRLGGAYVMPFRGDTRERFLKVVYRDLIFAQLTVPSV